MREGQMFDVGDLVRLTRDVSGYFRKPLRDLTKGEIIKIAEYKEKLKAHRHVYRFEDEHRLNPGAFWTDMQKNFELYKRHDMEFCLGDRVDSSFLKTVVTVSQVRREGTAPYLVSSRDNAYNAHPDELTLIEPAPDRPEWLIEGKQIIKPEELSTEEIRAVLEPEYGSEREKRTGRRDTEL